MKLPNGYGSVYKLSGKRRNPWVARVTTGFKMLPEKKRAYPIYKFIGYYPTRPEALTALSDYNKDPYDLKYSSITFAEVYDKWSDKKFESISQSNISGYKAAYKTCEKLYDMRFVDIKLEHLQRVVDESGKNYPTLRKLKVLFGQLFDYAVVHEIISKERHLVEYVDIKNAPNPNAFDRKPFSKKEVAKVWDCCKTNEYIQVILILLYTGLRIGELLSLKKENVNTEEQWFDVVTSKTNAGIRRVPIADKVLPFFNYWMTKNNCGYLISTPDGDPFVYRNYYDSYWTPFMEIMGLTHRPHDTRHTCISMLAAAGIQDKIIKKIVGHKGQSVTEVVYTHFEIKELIDAINKI